MKLQTIMTRITFKCLPIKPLRPVSARSVMLLRVGHAVLVNLGVDEPVDFTAWTAERQCMGCTPTAWVMVTGVLLLAGGTLKARAEPGEMVERTQRA